MGSFSWAQSRDTQWFREIQADGLKVVVTAERVEEQPEKWRTSITSTCGGYAELFRANAKRAKSPDTVRLLLADLLRQCGSVSQELSAKGAA